MNIVDVGAGKYKEYEKWLSNFPSLKIHAIEPHPDNFERLVKMRSTLQPQSLNRLHLHKVAISNTPSKQLPFFINNDKSSGSLLPLVEKNVRRWINPVGRRFLKTINTINVEVISLSKFIESNRISTIELLNVDVQGSSLDVLESMSMKSYHTTKQILVKAHSPGCVELYESQCDGYDVTRCLKKRYFTLLRAHDYSFGQEQIMNFINEPMKNRGAKLNGFAE